MDQIKRNESLANDLKKFVIDNDLAVDVRIYFNDTCYDWSTSSVYGGEPNILYDINPSHYFEYANDQTVSMSFEGTLNHILNYGASSRLEKEFDNIFSKHNCYYEFGHAWNLTVYFD